jgi:hypothetical protein
MFIYISFINTEQINFQKFQFNLIKYKKFKYFKNYEFSWFLRYIFYLLFYF